MQKIGGKESELDEASDTEESEISQSADKFPNFDLGFCSNAAKTKSYIQINRVIEPAGDQKHRHWTEVEELRMQIHGRAKENNSQNFGWTKTVTVENYRE